MYSPSQRFARFMYFFALMVCSATVLTPAPAAAETSYHKLKVRLRRAERNTGEVLKVVGGVVVDVLANVEFDPGDVESNAVSACARARTERPASPAAPPASHASRHSVPAKASHPVGRRMP